MQVSSISKQKKNEIYKKKIFKPANHESAIRGISHAVSLKQKKILNLFTGNFLNVR